MIRHTANPASDDARAIDVVVVGSANHDQILQTHTLPVSGETVFGRGISWQPGGKGLNQAIAAARFGAATAMIASLGDDAPGRELLATLIDEGINVDGCRCLGEQSTGTALVTVDDRGANTIVVLPGANASLDALHATDRDRIRNAAVLLCQLEVPLSIITAAAAEATNAGALVILNASPAMPLPGPLPGLVDVLVVNEHEVEHQHLDRLNTALIVTRGADGADYVPGRSRVPQLPSVRLHVDPPAVTAVDTTGAGDTFAGTLAAALAQTHSMPRALELAAAAASLAVQHPGASAAIPRATETVRQWRNHYPSTTPADAKTKHSVGEHNR